MRLFRCELVLVLLAGAAAAQQPAPSLIAVLEFKNHVTGQVRDVVDGTTIRAHQEPVVAALLHHVRRWRIPVATPNTPQRLLHELVPGRGGDEDAV